MNYIIIICVSIALLHFVLYYLNIEPFELSSKPKNNVINNDTCTNVKGINDTCTNIKGTNDIANHNASNSTCTKDIEESINELKKLNEYIDNESRPITQC